MAFDHVKYNTFVNPTIASGPLFFPHQNLNVKTFPNVYASMRDKCRSAGQPSIYHYWAAWTGNRFRSVVVITFASHAKGPGFETRRNLVLNSLDIWPPRFELCAAVQDIYSFHVLVVLIFYSILTSFCNYVKLWTYLVF